MPLFGKKQDLSDKEKKLSVVAFWLFFVTLFAGILPFAFRLISCLLGKSMERSSALWLAFWQSTIIFTATAALCTVAYLVYKKLILKL